MLPSMNLSRIKTWDSWYITKMKNCTHTQKNVDKRRKEDTDDAD